MDLIVVTGMSGAGKSQAINALEDMGFFCVDNVPPRLISKFAELPAQSQGNISRVALVVDTRSKELFTDFMACMQELRDLKISFQTLFLDCDDKVLMRRYKETRRRHPLMGDHLQSLDEAISAERKLLSTVKSSADFTVDTSFLSTSKMKTRVQELFADGVNSFMKVSVTSFGFKRGTPGDADLVFDVRCLPNPYWEASLREKTGLDPEVRDYVLGSQQSKGLVPKLLDLIDYLIPLYSSEGKSQLVIAIGCTGGKHRSVVFVELLAAHLKERGVPAWISHRDRELPNLS